MFAVMSGLASAAAPEGGPPLDDLEPKAQAKVQAGIQALLRGSGPKSATRPPNDLAWDCIALAALMQRGEERAANPLREIASNLESQLIVRAGVTLGWPARASSPRCANGGYDAFNDGSCNAPDTTYAFQTGLAMACLAEAGSLLKTPRLVQLAQAVDDQWRRRLLPKAPCADCSYFPISDNVNDAGRYVRNMNVFMGFGEAAVYAADRSDARRKAAAQALGSDMAEVGQGNRGYLGRLDRAFVAEKAESDRIENHSAAVAMIALRSSQLLGEPRLANHGLEVWRTWAHCNNDRCRKSDCNYWAGDPAKCQATVSGAHCAFRQLDDSARRLCQAYLAAAPRVPSVGVWAVLLGERKP